MYSLAVGAACASADIVKTLSNSQICLGLGRFSSANQYIFKVTTRPANKANQLKFTTSRGAIAIIAMLTASLTASHTKKPKPAVAALMDENRLIKPRAKSAAGIITASAP